MSTSLGWGDTRSRLVPLCKGCKMPGEEPARGEPQAKENCELCKTTPAARYVWITTRGY